MNRDVQTLEVYEFAGKPRVLLPGAKVSARGATGFQNKDMTQTIYESQMNSSSRWAWWGELDDMPTTIRCKLEKVPVAMAAIEKLAKMMYGNGLMYFREDDITDGDGKIKRQYLPEVEAFLKTNRILTHWLPAQIMDYRLYMNCFSELIWNLGKTKITGLYHKPAEFCRLSRQNRNTRDIDWLLFSAKFVQQYGGPPPQEEITAIPLYRWYDEQAFFEKLQKMRFAWHTHFPTPGISYYARPLWMGLFKENGWLDISANVPKIVSAMQMNQVTLKYQIQVPMDYFKMRYKDWDSYTQEQHEEKISSLTTMVENYLTGAENWFKSLVSYFEEDMVNGTPRGLIKIVAIDDKTKAGTWIPDSNISDAQIVQGLGLHPSQMGLAPEGGKMGAGSGSDQRESYNTAISLNTIDQQIILEPLNKISEINGWGVRFVIDNIKHTTTNNQETGIVPDPNRVTVT